jgi:hypothetical protein
MGVPPDSVTVSVALVIVAALSMRQWNDSLWLLVDSMFRSVKGYPMKGAWLDPGYLSGSIDGASNRLIAAMLIEERRHRHLRIPAPK